jgi:uracil-DNA glycosylase family 4
VAISNRAIPGKGPLEAPIALVGEQPGKTEVIKRECFVGPAGRELDSILRMAEIPRTACYVTNTFKDLDHPLSGYIEFLKNGGAFLTEAGKEYAKLLKEELEYVKPNIVVAIGGAALYVLTDRTGIFKWRGSIIESTLIPGQKVIPTIHPATILPPKNQYLNTHLILLDLIRAREHSGERKINITDRNVILKPSYYHCLERLEFVYEYGLSGQIIDFDIEVVREELSCLSFAWSPVESICIPFTDGFNDYFTIDQESNIMLWVAKIMGDERISKRGQNIVFDISYMFYKYRMITRGDIHDTMIAQKITMPDFPVGLDFITSVHTDIPYYKADGKKYFKVGGSIEKFWQYNGMDTISTAAAHMSQAADLIKQNNVEAYNRQRRIIYPITFMSMNGIKIDMEGMKQGRINAENEIVKLEARLAEIAGRQINWNSSQQMINYFYVEKKEKPYKKRNKEGKYVDTVDVNALKRLARKGYEEAFIIKKLRNLKNKVLGTYLDLDKIDVDGRFRSYYNPVGGETGRLSSSKNIITGKGGNQQNIPHELLKYFITDDGYVIYSIDISQGENRIVAYVGRIIPMIEAFENNIDVHSLTASLIFGKPIDEVSDEEESSDLGDGTHSERFWGKKANHGLNYDLGYKTFALYYEMPEQDAKWIIEKYHNAYPGVREGFHLLVQNMLRKNRTIENLFGRKRLFLNEWGDKLFKEAYAQIPQSTIADLIDERGLSYIYYNEDKFRPVRLMAQIHDSIVFGLPLSIPWERHAEIVMDIKSSLEQPLVFHEREFILPADVSIGLNMFKKEMREFKSRKIPNDTIAFAKMLEGAYNEITETLRKHS